MRFLEETGVVSVDGWDVGYAVFEERMEVLSSAVLNGGDSMASAIFIMQVPKDYCCDDPLTDAVRVRDALGLPEDTVGMMTAAEVGRVFNSSLGECNGVEAVAIATAGLSNHVVAGETLDNYPERRIVSDARAARIAGTINIAVLSPFPLTMTGKVNLMIPLVEAKSAAMADRGYRETGTTSDSIAVLCPAGDDRIDYTGTGSDIGIAAARAVRSAVGCALERRCEHPVMEEPFRLLENAGYGLGRMMEMSGTGLSEDDFRSKVSEALGSKDVRAMIDIAIFCRDRADSMAEDGETSSRDLLEGMFSSVAGSDMRYDDTMECAVMALLIRAGVTR